MSDRIETPQELGAAIRRRRTELRLTQEALAAAARISPRLLGEIERGKRTTQLGGLLRLLGALGLELHLKAR